MKVTSISTADLSGGAARAAYRIHRALVDGGVDSSLRVNQSTSGDWTVEGPQSKLAKVLAATRATLAARLTKTLKTGNPVIHSPAIVPSRWSKGLNASDADLIHLHWVNGEMLSVADIGKINKPVVWTLHDMWAFCGAEHVTADFRWRDGYKSSNRPSYESGFDLNRWTAARKLKHWKRPMQIVTPSRWLADCAKQSVLMRDWPISVIPNAIDVEAWQPVSKAQARQLLNLPPGIPLLLFGAWGGTNDHHKGFDLLQASLQHLHGEIPGLELLVFGQLPPKKPLDIGFPVNYSGHLHDIVSLRLLYSAADAMVIPSRIDNLPNTGLEAHACGIPVVAFDTCGLPDIVVHKKTGYLAKAFDSEDLAHGLKWTLQSQMNNNALGNHARERAVALWSYPVISKKYIAMYELAVSAFKNYEN